MKLAELLRDLEYKAFVGNSTEETADLDVEISEVVNDNRKVTKDCIFLCIEGANFDGHSAAGEAAEKGAAAIVVQKDVELPSDSKTIVVKVENTRYAMAFISAAWFGHPDRKSVV